MKYLDVVANGRARLWRGEKATRRNHQKYKPQMEQRSAGGMTSSNVKIGAKLSHGVVAVLKSLHFALP